MKPLVLLVDDDVAIRDGLAELLETEGYDVATAMDGGEALEIMRGGFRPNVIVLDLLMPGIDGWDFRVAQLENGQIADIPVVVISASGFSAETVKPQLGVNDYFKKPLDTERFVSALNRVAASA